MFFLTDNTIHSKITVFLSCSEKAGSTVTIIYERKQILQTWASVFETMFLPRLDCFSFNSSCLSWHFMPYHCLWRFSKENSVLVPVSEKHFKSLTVSSKLLRLFSNKTLSFLKLACSDLSKIDSLKGKKNLQNITSNAKFQKLDFKRKRKRTTNLNMRQTAKCLYAGTLPVCIIGLTGEEVRV